MIKAISTTNSLFIQNQEGAEAVRVNSDLMTTRCQIIVSYRIMATPVKAAKGSTSSTSTPSVFSFRSLNSTTLII